ncbi:type III restriction-modification system endonuclease [Fusobacterium mortiferum]|uniref:type III restriction-modification system endonuclease n=1 Tax=Fusobacterium mortiferum TaxID=850 RepID=UPI001F3D9605|nr:type III restriction-modification system endonuclease [Fusobacterium mortiferum]MCF2699847.1 type III restriction-modification system endonuclease [Fusobacterium mortiferum]
MNLQLSILPHQTKVLDIVNKVFKNIEIYSNSIYKNPEINFNDERLYRNIEAIQNGSFEEIPNINKEYRGYVKDEPFGIDIKMETGTGKTYCYTRLMYELNKNYGFNKFIILVPSTPIKEGTKTFIESDYARHHFYDLYPNSSLRLDVLNAQKKNKKGRKMFPQAISNFIRNTTLEKNKINCLLMTDKMLISTKTMEAEYDQTLLGGISVPYKALKEVRPIVIIDEPHRFKRENEAYKCLVENINPQMIIRFGATFNKNEKTGVRDYNNLVYNLDSVSAFNNGLVKGVIVETLGEVKEEDVKLKLLKIENSKPKKAILKNEKTGKVFELGVGEYLSEVSEEFSRISIQYIGKCGANNSSTGILLSNDQVLSAGDSIFSSIYTETYQRLMLKQAIKNHFDQEKINFLRKRKIKTLSLFFIDSIFSYRGENNDGDLKIMFESLLKEELKERIRKIKENISNDLEKEYLDFLECSLKDVSATNGGYFSNDNSTSDEDIQNEIDLILRDKETLLSFKNKTGNWNTMRFIFSKWTLREGWDNPNVFQIAKLRSSGSENSKLQEVGRGLRLPVDEYGNRISDEEFYLTYLIDFSEKEFAKQLIAEVNSDTKQVFNIGTLLEKVAIQKGTTSKKLFIELLSKDYVDEDKNIIKENSTAFYEEYPEFNQGVKNGKIKDGKEKNKNYIAIRKENFNKLKPLWEAINKKHYLRLESLSDEEISKAINEIFQDIYSEQLIHTKRERVIITDDKSMIKEEEGRKYTVKNKIPYNEFLKKLNKETGFSLPLLHKGFIELSQKIKFPEDFFNGSTLKNIINKYQEWLEKTYINRFSYQKMNISTFETALTYFNGEVKESVLQGTVGLFKDNNFNISDKFLYDTLVYDSPLERENIKNSNIDEVVVFGKIPRRSIKVPLYFGGTTSPDFMYVLKKEDGSLEMNLILETKDVKKESQLRGEEKLRIESAKKFFETLKNEGVNVKFKEQMKEEDIVGIIYKTLE